MFPSAWAKRRRSRRAGTGPPSHAELDGRASERRQLDWFRYRRDAPPGPRGLQVRQTGSKAVELGIDGVPVMAGSRVPPKCFADQSKRGGRPSKLVFSAGDALLLDHTASVSL
jgi:hypothetical protein